MISNSSLSTLLPPPLPAVLSVVLLRGNALVPPSSPRNRPAAPPPSSCRKIRSPITSLRSIPGELLETQTFALNVGRRSDWDCADRFLPFAINSIMALHNKDPWGSNVTGHVSDPSRTGQKRANQWFMDPAEPDLFPSKKQALQRPNSHGTAGITHPNLPQWGSTPSIPSVPSQFVERLFGSEAERPVRFVNDSSLMRTKGFHLEDQFGDDIPVALPLSHSSDDHVTGLRYNGFQRVKEDRMKDFHAAAHATRISGFEGKNVMDFIPLGQSGSTEFENVPLVDHGYGIHSHSRSMGSSYEKGGNNDMITIGDAYGKGDGVVISFSDDEHNVVPIPQPMGSFDKSYNQSSVQTTEINGEKQVDALNISTTSATKSTGEAVMKNKPENNKESRKRAPYSFPTNVRSLLSTGMLDGIPIKYVATSKEELRGIIKGLGYLCGCQSCNYSKILNAYEFERHAGAKKTKHPNSHMYFGNGKSIYQIVQELRSTPVSMLFETIQTVFGTPINQKAFRIWKESFQAATLELQRIYGKDEFDL